MYKLWKVYDLHEVKYYIVNPTTNSVQSAWKSYTQAESTLRSLNSMMKLLRRAATPARALG